ncbi:MAG: rod shape-determining protein MreC [Acidiferrobacterales bacterium]
MIGASGKPVRTVPLLVRLILFSALAIGIMLLDQRGQRLRQIRSTLSVLTYPLIALAAVPARLGGWMSSSFTSEEEYRRRYETLREGHRIQQARLQKYEALDAENIRLRSLLGSATRVADRAIVAELVEVSTEPFTRTIVIGKGRRDGVFLGQPVLDAYGVVGQVTEVNPYISRITLITDPGHAIPVQVKRNGLRTILAGTGADDALEISYLTGSADIKIGDLLITSGLGGRFPPRFPVARITRVVNDPNEAFLSITAAPVARLRNHKEVLLVWPGKQKKENISKKGSSN